MQVKPSCSIGRVKTLIGLLAVAFGFDCQGLVLRNAAHLAILRGVHVQDSQRLARGYELATAWPRGGAIVGPDSHLRAVAAMELGDTEAAINLLKDSAGEDHRDPVLLYWLGVAYERAGDHDRATTTWIRAGAGTKVVETANKRLRAGNMEDALREYDRIVAIAPSFAPGHRGKGEVALRRADWVSAQAEFETVLAADPTDVVSLVGAGLAKWKLDRDEVKARDLIRQALTHHPQCVWCLLTLAQVEQEAGQERAAKLARDEAQHFSSRKQPP